MPTDFAFRLSTYFSLAMACVCVGFAEWEFLPEVTAFTLVIIGMMCAAFIADGHGWSLSLGAANRLGGMIFVIAAIWLGWNYRNPDSIMNTLPWPASGLFYVAALMMVLTPAKLFRPKHVGDWWALQGLGLAMVAVAASFSEDLSFMILIGIYTLTVVWSLTLFYIRRSAGHIAPPPPPHPLEGWRSVFDVQTYIPHWLIVQRSRPTVAEPFAGIGKPTPTERLGRSHFFRAVRWLVVGGALAVPFFFLTPRGNGVTWELNRTRLESGLSLTGVNLSRTGNLRLDPEVVFEFTATTPQGEPVDGLPTDLKFRVTAYTLYEYGRGRWSRGPGSKLVELPRTLFLPTRELKLPDLGPNQVNIAFERSPKMVGVPVIWPIAVPLGQPPAVVSKRVAGYSYARQNIDGSYVLDGFETRIMNYWQAITLPNLNEHEPSFRLASIRESGIDPRGPLLDAPSRRITTYARQQFQRFLDEGRLSPTVRARINPVSLLPDERDFAEIATVFALHLATNLEFSYSLSLRRQDKSIDPIEDFFFNVKSGHCERFAAALVHLLRGIGIPSQFTIGYRGCEPLGDGRYVVRQEHAHAWVESLVPTSNGEYRWLVLDPVSLIDGVPTTPTGGNQTTSERFFSRFITGLNQERQKKIREDAKQLAKEKGPWVLGIVFSVVACLAVAWVLLRRSRRVLTPLEPPTDPLPWWTRAIDALASRGVVWQAGQTPHEFSRIAHAWLQTHAATVADVPNMLAAALDRSRYAEATLSHDDVQRLEAAVDRLVVALKS